MMLPGIPSPAGYYPNSPVTQFQGFGAVTSALGFPHIQFWPPVAATHVFVIHQIAIGMSLANAAGVVGFKLCNCFRHNVALAVASTSEPWDIPNVDVGGTHNGQVRTEDAAAPLGSLGTLVMSFGVQANLVDAAAVQQAPGQPIIYPVAFRGIFNATDGLTFVPQDPIVGFYVGIWWSEVRLNI